MIGDLPWGMVALTASMPIAGLIGGLFGGNDDDEGDEEQVDQLLNDSFQDEVTFEGEDPQEGTDDPFETDDDTRLYELEDSVDQLEDEVSSLSATVSTVRSENEEIADIVSDIEEDIRQLLEIYEMVTQGINPFVDEDPGIVQSPSGNDGGFAILNEQDSSGSTETTDNEAVLDADAEDFFDEEAVPEPEQDPAVDPVESSDATAKNFDELKAEYESDDVVGPAQQSSDGAPSTTTAVATEEAGEVHSDVDDQPADDADQPPTGGTSAETTTSAAVPGESKPYLSRLPSEPMAELTVLEWLESIQETADVAGAQAAIEYYGRIGWIDDDVIGGLEEYLSGFGDIPDEAPSHVPAEMDREDHVRTLRYLLTIDGSSTAGLVGEHLQIFLEEPNRPAPSGIPLTDGANVETTGEAHSEESGEGEPTLPDGGLAMPEDEFSAPTPCADPQTEARQFEERSEASPAASSLAEDTPTDVDSASTESIPGSTTEPPESSVGVPTDRSVDRSYSTTPAPGAVNGTKPYLSALPDEPMAELTVLEWLDSLLERTDGRGARSALAYYARIGWIDESLLAGLEEYLTGFARIPTEEPIQPLPNHFDRHDHVQTLRYLLTIDGASTAGLVGEHLESILEPTERRTPDRGETSTEQPPTSPEEPPNEDVTLPDGGLALPVDELPGTGVGRDGD